MVTIDILVLFRTIVASEFKNKSDAEILAFQSEAEIEISEKVFGLRYSRAVALLTAHLMSMEKRSQTDGGSTAIGQLKRVKVGQLEREYSVAGSGSSADSNDSFHLTDYGKEFLRLRKQVLTSMRFATY